VSHVKHEEAGAASSMLNIGQMVGGSIGLAAIGTIAWTAVASSVNTQMAAAAAAGGGSAATGGQSAASAETVAGVPAKVIDHALTVGFSHGLLIAGLIMLSGFFVAVFATYTPGWRLVSARHEGREQPCDETLGTC
jgi:hypothetical protein